MGKGGLDAVMAVEVRGRQRLGGLLSRVSESRTCRVAAASRPGLLRRVRGPASAPISSDRHAVVLRPDLDYVMVAAFAGRGSHGAELAEVAADVVSEVLERRLLGGREWASEESSVISGGSAGSLGAGAVGEKGGVGMDLFPVSVELAMQDAFVEASIAVDATPWAKHSGTTATVVVIRRGEMVVGSIGDCVVHLGRRRSGVVGLQRLHGMHSVHVDKLEAERVSRFGGIIHHGGFVSDKADRKTIGVSRCLGETEMRAAGVCQLPQIGTMNITHRDVLVVLSTVPLWEGEEMAAPAEISATVNQLKSTGPFDIARGLLDVAFGAAGPASDATLVCMQLRR